jgi:hypothetical protein
MTTASAEYSQARIRVNAEGARLLQTLLRTELDRVMQLRAELQHARITQGVAGYNLLIARIRRVLDEVERTIEEQDW